VIIASTRQNRNGEKVARWYHSIASRRHDLEAELVDLRDYPLPFLYAARSPGSGEIAPEAGDWAAKIAPADGYVLVTPEYNRGYPGELKNALDHLYRQWNRKAVGIVSYGGMAGGARAAEQLRLVAIELQMAPIREGIVIPMIHQAFDEHGRPKDDSLTARAESMLDQLSWWTRALKAARG
jgi:NAD(P)H-dependent FMN reductase